MSARIDLGGVVADQFGMCKRIAIIIALALSGCADFNPPPPKASAPAKVRVVYVERVVKVPGKTVYVDVPGTVADDSKQVFVLQPLPFPIPTACPSDDQIRSAILTVSEQEFRRRGGKCGCPNDKKSNHAVCGILTKKPPLYCKIEAIPAEIIASVREEMHLPAACKS